MDINLLRESKILCLKLKREKLNQELRYLYNYREYLIKQKEEKGKEKEPPFVKRLVLKKVLDCQDLFYFKEISSNKKSLTYSLMSEGKRVWIKKK